MRINDTQNPLTPTLSSAEESGLLDVRTMALSLQLAKEQRERKRAEEERARLLEEVEREQEREQAQKAASAEARPELPQGQAVVVVPREERPLSPTRIAAIFTAAVGGTVGLLLAVLFFCGVFHRDTANVIPVFIPAQPMTPAKAPAAPAVVIAPDPAQATPAPEASPALAPAKAPVKEHKLAKPTRATKPSAEPAKAAEAPAETRGAEEPKASPQKKHSAEADDLLKELN